MIVGTLARIENLAVYQGLVVVDVWSIVRNEGPARRAVRLGINELAEAVDGWQERSLRLHGIFMRQLCRDGRGVDLLGVLPCPLQGVLQRQIECARLRRLGGG